MLSPRQCVRFAVLVLSLSSAVAARAAETPDVMTGPPDSASVERYGPAYRYPQAGWIVLHIEGEPYERGVQHGRLMAPEIAEIVRAAAVNQSPKSPEDGWSQMRTLADALFLRRYDHEFLVEMKGIADGAAAAGAKFEGRPIDLVDIVSVNAWTEVEFLDAALRATPKGIEGIRRGDLLPTRAPTPPPSRCSSFIATGPATANGEIVFGHITMWSLQPARHFNVWLDIKPAKGNRVLMQSYPSGVQSTADYYMNDAGILVSETTISQTRFNADGLTESSRIRRALQYGNSIDDVVQILKTSNNGLYSNEWLIGDTKTNEIAMFELGTAKNRLWRSSKSEWFGDTPGFYWGCNNTKDLDVRLETLPSLSDKPTNVVFRPTDRDLMWQRLYTKHRGKIDSGFGFEAFTTPPLAAAHSLDAKFTTTAMARELKTYALFGPPLGRTWEPSDYERQRYGDNIKPLVSNGWTRLDATPPAGEGTDPKRRRVVDLATSSPISGGRSGRGAGSSGDEADGAAWHGTLLPNRAGDVWLAAAWADYERIVSYEKAIGAAGDPSSIFDAASDPSNLTMFPYFSQLMLAARTEPAMTLANLQVSEQSNNWYDLAAGKGVWILAELRSQLGAAKFDELMRSFGRDFGGKPADAAEFRRRAEKAADPSNHDAVVSLFQSLVDTPAIPAIQLANVEVVGEGSAWHVRGQIEQTKVLYPASVELMVETQGDPVTQVLLLGAAKNSFDVSTTSRPRSITVDPRNQRLHAQGTVFSTRSFERELEQSLIVYGSGPESASHREMAELLQRRIATQWSNYSVPIKSDREVSDAELKSNHLLLVGRPAMNSVANRFSGQLSVQFGAGSFTVAGRTYAHPASAVVAAAANPTNSRYSVVVFAGLGAESTRRVVQTATPFCEVSLWPAGKSPQSLVLPARELTVSFPAGD
jgi:hypothetical protein